VRVEPTPGLLGLLAALYPTVRWDEVSFHEGIPAPFSLFTQGGITLPEPLGTHGIRIHVARWDPCSVPGLALLVHEAFHVLQYQESLPGISLLRGFTVKYLFRATWEGGAERNLYEKPAYAQGNAFERACRALPRPLCRAGTVDLEMQAELLRRSPALVRRTSHGA
jgi:hypothetical protein